MNWIFIGSATTYAETAAVNFGNIPGDSTITVANVNGGGVSPGSTTISNSGNKYTFTGGSILTGSLTMLGRRHGRTADGKRVCRRNEPQRRIAHRRQRRQFAGCDFRRVEFRQRRPADLPNRPRVVAEHRCQHRRRHLRHQRIQLIYHRRRPHLTTRSQKRVTGTWSSRARSRWAAASPSPSARDP